MVSKRVSFRHVGEYVHDKLPVDPETVLSMVRSGWRSGRIKAEVGVVLEVSVASAEEETSVFVEKAGELAEAQGEINADLTVTGAAGVPEKSRSFPPVEKEILGIVNKDGAYK